MFEDNTMFAILIVQYLGGNGLNQFKTGLFNQ